MTAVTLSPLSPDPEHIGTRWARPYALAGERRITGRVYVGASVTFRRHGQKNGREMLPWEPDALPVFSVWFDMSGPTAGEGTLTSHGVTYRGGVYRTVPAREHSNIRFDGTVYEPVDVLATRVGYEPPTDSARRLFWEMSEMVREILLTPEGRDRLILEATTHAIDKLDRERDAISASILAGRNFRHGLTGA